MKLNGIIGKGTGKLGSSVFAVRNGIQIVREYTDKVENPKTVAQVAQRAKFKLMSQLSAAFGAVVAMPKMGIVSPRNMFVKKNIEKATVADGDASITLTTIEITDSAVALPALSLTPSAGAISIGLTVGDEELDQMVYAIFVKTDDAKLRYVASTVYTTPGADNRYVYGRNLPAGEYVVYGYGVRFNSESARVKYGELMAQSGETVAKLVADRVVTSEDITLTETRAEAATVTGA